MWQNGSILAIKNQPPTSKFLRVFGCIYVNSRQGKAPGARSSLMSLDLIRDEPAVVFVIKWVSWVSVLGKVWQREEISLAIN